MYGNNIPGHHRTAARVISVKVGYDINKAELSVA